MPMLVLFPVGLEAFILSISQITDLIGSKVTRNDKMTGLFPVLATGAPTCPYITYSQVSGTPVESMDGVNRLGFARFRFSCYGSSYLSAKLLANAMKMAFNSYVGFWQNGIEIQHCVVETEADDTEALPRGTIFASHIDISFGWIDPDPSIPFTPTGPPSTDIDGGSF